MKVEEFYELLLRSCQSSCDRKQQLSIQDHFKRIWNRPDVLNAKLDPSNDGTKSAEKSAEFKRQGNEAYVRSQYSSALAFYNKAILEAPQSDPEKLSLAYGNRSAVLYQTGQYGKCLEDIATAFKYGYPEEKMLKLYQRKAACYEALGDHREATISYKIAMEKCHDYKMLSDIQNRMKALDLMSNRKHDPMKYSADPWKPVPLVAGGESSEMTLSNAVKLEQNETRGHHYIAQRDIEPGEVILVEKPYMHLLIKGRYLTNCNNCAKRSPIPTPCRSCSTFVYCGEKCENEAWESFHKIECSANPYVEKLSEKRVGSGASGEGSLNVIGTFSLALRAILKVGAEALHKKFVEQNGKVDLKHDMSSNFASDAFPSLTKLLWKDIRDNRRVWSAAIVMLKVLQQTAFFDALHIAQPGTNFEERTTPAQANRSQTLPEFVDNELTSRNTAIEFEAYVGATLYILYLICERNKLTVREYEITAGPAMRGPCVSSGGMGWFVAVCASLFNHSCYPNVSYVSYGTTVVVRATRSVPKGEELCLSYNSSVFTKESLRSRQRSLKSMFGFDCACQACAGNWPMEPTEDWVLCPRCKRQMPADLEKCRSCNADLPNPETLYFGPAGIGILPAIREFERTGAYSDKVVRDNMAALKALERHFAPPCTLIVEASSVIVIYFQTMGNCYDMRQACSK